MSSTCSMPIEEEPCQKYMIELLDDSGNGYTTCFRVNIFIQSKDRKRKNIA